MNARQKVKQLKKENKRLQDLQNTRIKKPMTAYDSYSLQTFEYRRKIRNEDLRHVNTIKTNIISCMAIGLTDYITFEQWEDLESDGIIISARIQLAVK